MQVKPQPNPRETGVRMTWLFLLPWPVMSHCREATQGGWCNPECVALFDPGQLRATSRQHFWQLRSWVCQPWRRSAHLAISTACSVIWNCLCSIYSLASISCFFMRRARFPSNDRWLYSLETPWFLHCCFWIDVKEHSVGYHLSFSTFRGSWHRSTASYSSRILQWMKTFIQGDIILL